MKRALSHIAEYWYKYLLEILVIVLGVLGAFALNSWNEGRTRLETERQVLEQIAADLARTVESVEGVSSFHKTIIARGGSLLAHMDSGEPYSPDLAYLFAGAFFFGQVDNDLGGYKTMQPHGVDIVSNRELRNAIIKHYERTLTVIKRREQILFDFADKVKLHESQKYFEYNFGVEGYFTDGVPASDWSNIRLKSEPRDYEVLRTSSEYRYQIRTYMETVKWFDVSVQVFGRETADLVEAINAEVAARF